MSYNATAIQIIEEALRSVARELIDLAPRILIGVLILALIIVIGMIIHRLIKKILNLIKLEDMLKPYIEKYQIPFSPESIILALLVIGLTMLATYSVALAIAPEHIEIVDKALDVMSKIASVAFMIIIVSVSLFIVVDRLRIERGLRGFTFLLAFLIALVLLIDITTLSSDLKHALAWGLSLGIGLSIGVFTAWYFFGEILRKRTEQSK